MKHIRILHLYSNALDLYGDYKNLRYCSAALPKPATPLISLR